MEGERTEFSHSSVLLAEIVSLLAGSPRTRVVVDATLGLGGHSEAILEKFPETSVIGIDRDMRAIASSEKRLSRFGDRFRSVHADFSRVSQVIDEAKLGPADAIIADLGVSSMQLDDASRGFSFRSDAPLDMRMDPSGDEQTAAELLGTIGEVDLANLIYKFGEERFSRRIARRIIERREAGDPVITTTALAELINRLVPRRRADKIDPATRTFQALRIAVNHELDEIEKFLTDAVDSLTDQGLLAVISFHSLEDRIVKRTFQRLSGKCECPPRMPVCVCGAAKRIEILTRKPIVPGEYEQRENARSRSAKLRACRKLGLAESK